VAERCIQTAIRRITGDRDWTAPQTADVRPADRPEDRVVATAARRPVQAPRRGIRFTETMRGTIPLAVAEDAAPVPRPASVVLTVTIPDLDAFLADPLHTATVSGRVYLGALTGADGAAVRGGALHLLTCTGTGRRTMAYLLPFTGADGRRWALRGSKAVWHRRGLMPGWDVWRATTTLYAAVIPLHDPSPAGPGAGTEPTGTLRLTFPDFVRELRTIRATGTGTTAEALGTLLRFLAFFLDSLRRAFVPGTQPEQRSSEREQETR
jgi:cholesterol oxidase